MFRGQVNGHILSGRTGTRLPLPNKVADAKWKILDDREKKLGISQSDLYQMAGYATRYRVDRLALIYPRQQWLKNFIEFEIQGTYSVLKIIPVDVTKSREIPNLPYSN